MPLEKPKKPELLKEDNTLRIEDLEKKIMMLEGYAQRTEFFARSLERKAEKLKEEKLKKALASIKGGF
jgi:hypothetical protein